MFTDQIQGAYKAGRQADSEAGLSLLEVLFATLLLLGIALGVLGLYSRSLANNTYGTEATLVNNIIKAEHEELLQVPLNHPQFTFDPSGTASTERMISERCSIEVPGAAHTLEWLAGPCPDPDPDPSDLNRWEIEVVVRQLAYDDIFQGTLDLGTGTTLVQRGHPDLFDQPLSNDAPIEKIHFKEVEVQVVGRREANAFGAGQIRTTRRLRSF